MRAAGWAAEVDAVVMCVARICHGKEQEQVELVDEFEEYVAAQQPQAQLLAFTPAVMLIYPGPSRLESHLPPIPSLATSQNIF